MLCGNRKYPSVILEKYCTQSEVLKLVLSERYRLQSDKFEAMWLIAKELSSRLNNYYNKGKTGGFSIYYSGTVPLQEYFDLIDIHFEVMFLIRYAYTCMFI